MDGFTTKLIYETPLTKPELSALWGVSTRTIDREVASGKLGCVMIGGRVRFLDEHIRSYLDSMSVPAKNQMTANAS